MVQRVTGNLQLFGHWGRSIGGHWKVTNNLTWILRGHMAARTWERILNFFHWIVKQQTNRACASIDIPHTKSFISTCDLQVQTQVRISPSVLVASVCYSLDAKFAMHRPWTRWWVARGPVELRWQCTSSSRGKSGCGSFRRNPFRWLGAKRRKWKK